MKTYTLEQLNSNLPTIDKLHAEADKWIAFGTNNGTRELESSWEAQAVKRFKETSDVAKGILKGRGLAAEWASCRIALSKARTFGEIKKAANKLKREGL